MGLLLLIFHTAEIIFFFFLRTKFFSFSLYLDSIFVKRPNTVGRHFYQMSKCRDSGRGRAYSNACDLESMARQSIRHSNVHLWYSSHNRGASKRDSINKQKYDKRFVICIEKQQPKIPIPWKPNNNNSKWKRRKDFFFSFSFLRIMWNETLTNPPRHRRHNSDRTCIYVNFLNSRWDRSNSLDLEPCGWYTDGSTYRDRFKQENSVFVFSFYKIK